MAFLENPIVYALIGGVLPALLWLYFWLREDIHPEPKRLIVRAFFSGILAIPFALLLEAAAYCGIAYLFLNPGQAPLCGSFSQALLEHNVALFEMGIILAFAAAEEFVKYKCARKFVLGGKDFDEPVDAMIYLITVALGFAAFENFFFLISAFGEGVFQGLVIGNLRFLGATLLHAISSGVVGYALALAFYKPEKRRAYTIYGLIIATVLHAVFNIAVISEGDAENGLGGALLVLILTGIILILAFDRVKKIKSSYSATIID